MCIPIHEDVFLVYQESIERIGQVPEDLFHEVVAQRRRASGQMPSQDCVGREQSPDFFQRLAAQSFAADSQSAALIVVEKNSLLAEFFHKNFVFDSQVVDYILLLAIDPTSKEDEH